MLNSASVMKSQFYVQSNAAFIHDVDAANHGVTLPLFSDGDQALHER
jgi:hypothetical protein